VNSGMQLLLDDVLERDASGRRRPHVSKEPLAAIPADLPGPPGEGSHEVRSLVFWPPEAGDLVTLGDPGRAQDPRSRVALTLTADTTPDRWQDVIDAARSPLIEWHRCSWRTNRHLTPGLLRGMAEVTRLWPRELVRAFRSVETWLRKGSTRLDPFEYCDDLPVLPANRAPFAVWARPHAEAWVRAGGRIWPWTA
jgi:hypothetical protein